MPDNQEIAQIIIVAKDTMDTYSDRETAYFSLFHENGTPIDLSNMATSSDLSTIDGGTP